MKKNLWKRSALVLPFLPFLCAIFLAGCEELGIGGSEGARLWNQHCARCHGGQGQGSAGYSQYPIAINLRDDRWKYGSEPSVITDNILQGIFPAMPGFEGKLTDDEIRKIVDHLRTLRGD